MSKTCILKDECCIVEELSRQIALFDKQVTELTIRPELTPLHAIYDEMRTIPANQLTSMERRLYGAIQGILEGK
jgi:hypothetical protein